MYPPNKVTSTTSDRAKVIVAAGDLHCDSAMSANVVTQDDFYAHSGCAVSGWVKAKGDATMDAGSSVGLDLTSGGPAILNSVSSVGGSLTSGGTATLYSGSSVGKDLSSVGRVYLGSGSSVGGNLTTAGYADLRSDSSVGGNLSTASYANLDSGTSVGGDLTSTSYSDIEGTVKGNVVSGSYVLTGDNSSIEGSVTAAGTGRTWIHGTVGKDVTAVGPVTTHYNSVVTGDVIAAATSTTEIYGTVSGRLTAGGVVLIDYSGRVVGDTSAGTGTGTTTVRGRISGDLRVRGMVYVDNGATVSGTVVAAGTGITSVYGNVEGSLKVAGSVRIDWNGTVGANVTSSGTATDNIYGTVVGDLSAGGNVYLPAGSIGGDLTLPASRSLTPSDASSRVGGTVIRAAAPAAPAAPTAPTVSLTPPQVTVTAPAEPDHPHLAGLRLCQRRLARLHGSGTGQDELVVFGQELGNLPGNLHGADGAGCDRLQRRVEGARHLDHHGDDSGQRRRGVLRDRPAEHHVQVCERNQPEPLVHRSVVRAVGEEIPRRRPPETGRSISTPPTSASRPCSTPRMTSPTTTARSPDRRTHGGSTSTAGRQGTSRPLPVEFPIELFEATEPTTPSGTFSVTRLVAAGDRMNTLLVVFAGLLGLAFGSFANVVAYRVPAGVSLLRPSRCPSCEAPIRSWQNVPLLSWLLLRGRCAECAAPISPRYPLTEAVNGIAFALLAWFVPTVLGISGVAGGARLDGLRLVRCGEFGAGADRSGYPKAP